MRDNLVVGVGKKDCFYFSSYSLILGGIFLNLFLTLPLYAERSNLPQSCLKTSEELNRITADAQKNDPHSQLALGKEYLSGICVGKAEAEGVQLIQKAADQGLPEAQLELGRVYFNGQGVIQNKEQGFQWYQKAAQQGLKEAQYDLGGFYLNGWGVKKNEYLAIEWYKKAAQQGMVKAQMDLGNIYWYGISVQSNRPKAIQWFRQAAESGDGIAMSFLADVLLDGQGLPAEKQEAVSLYLKAAEQGLAGVQFKLGRLYEQGRDVERDYEKAYMWYTISEKWYHDFDDRKRNLAAQLSDAQKTEAENKAKEFLKAHPPQVEK